MKIQLIRWLIKLTSLTITCLGHLERLQQVSDVIVLILEEFQHARFVYFLHFESKRLENKSFIPNMLHGKVLKLFTWGDSQPIQNRFKIEKSLESNS